MKWQDYMGTVGNQQLFWRDRDTLRLDPLDLLDEADGINDHTVPNDIRL